MKDEILPGDSQQEYRDHLRELDRAGMPWPYEWPLDPEACEECRKARLQGRLRCRYHRLAEEFQEQDRRHAEILKAHGKNCECSEHEKEAHK